MQLFRDMRSDTRTDVQPRRPQARYVRSMKPRQIKAPEGLWRAAEQVAEGHGVTVAEYVRQVVATDVIRRGYDPLSGQPVAPHVDESKAASSSDETSTSIMSSASIDAST